MSITVAIIKSLSGLVSALKWWGKRKERNRREKSIDAISNSKRYDDKYK